MKSNLVRALLVKLIYILFSFFFYSSTIAQNTGDVVEGQFKVQYGGLITLPEGKWTVVASWKQKENGNWFITALKNNDKYSNTPYFVIRVQPESSRWKGALCDQSTDNKSMLMHDAHGTNASQLTNKCTRIWDLGSSLNGWARWVKAKDTDWWKESVINYGDLFDSDSSQMVMTESELRVYNKFALHLDIFIKVNPFGTSVDSLRAQRRSNNEDPAIETWRNWLNLMVDANMKSFFDNEKIQLSALKSNDNKNNQYTSNVISESPPSSSKLTTAPERIATVTNAQVPVAVPVGQVVTGQPTQITTNPLDLQKKTSGNEVWISFNPSITIQQRQFCRIVENFRTENELAKQTRNQIKINETFRTFIQSLVALLPNGEFQGWVMRTVYVSQASDGSAEVLLELPCNVYVGSNACDMNPKNFYGTAPEGSRIYTELAKMTVGDFAITSGKFVYADAKAFDRNRSVASFGYMKTADHCNAKSFASNADFFGLNLNVISTIK